ncbi:TRAP transporter large permease [uncultured Alsobacter sp.]|uniref:TRAP transporter large permease n=1 Tax=uncultured Alsobacter sp. TaxID=1748258 RepID=UPI0025CE449B|nr:TRAP transporter large permease subunit [uncultured Alsobacter sp.]
MGELSTVGLLIIALFVLLGSGVWIGLSLIGVGWMAMAFFTARPAGDAMAVTVFGSLSSWTLTALPLFIWMGEILFRSKLSENMFSALAPWMGRVPGRLLQTNVVGCAIFAAISGSSAATCATIGKMTLPELKKRGYPDSIAIGSLAGAGTLGLLIPPSLIMIVYGVSADVSIARLFIAGVIPGIMLALLFGGYLAWWAWRNPQEVPVDDFAGLGFGEKIRRSGGLIPTVLLIMAVLGSIYTGIATATESAAIGVVGALVLSAAQRTLTLQNFIAGLMGATRTTTMIMLILAGSAFLTIAMGFTGLPRDLALWVKSLNLSPLALIAALTVFFVILGCFLDGISMVVLTMAVLLPMVQAVGFDLVWFGIFIVLVVEMAQITPPVGFNLFVLQGMTGRNIFWIAKVSFPFFVLMAAAVALIVAFPGLATWLPGQMMGK